MKHLQTEVKNKSLSLRKSVNRASSGSTQNVQIQMPQRNPLTKPSSPLSVWKSKQSKSRRGNDPHEIPPLSWTDLLCLIPYYIALYAFYAAFWFGLWFIYQSTVDKDKPRISPLEGGQSRSALCQPFV